MPAVLGNVVNHYTNKQHPFVYLEKTNPMSDTTTARRGEALATDVFKTLPDEIKQAFIF